MTERSGRFRRVLTSAAPKIALFLALSVAGYRYTETWLWLLVFVFGSVATLVNEIYYQKTMDLRERLSR